jgi:hypothetical protein
MAGKAFSVIEVIDLSHVYGGVDKQTQAVQTAIAQATSAMEDVATATAPKDNSMSQMIMQMMNNRRSGSGPTPAPALPPTSTLSR